jgi:SAM-dependent methyltransferase
MDDDLLESYEEAPYLTVATYETHPDALATPAFLAGIDPAPVERCRVLEIGCATGGNVIALAAGLPDAKFTGIDISPPQIEIARQRMSELGLRNLQLVAANLVDAELEEIDYLICHGVFSWCSEPVQERILAVCQERLSPHGIAYISYNVYPGWHRLGLWRDLMVWGARAADTWRGGVREGLRFAELVAAAAGERDPQYSQLARDAVEKLTPLPADYLIHEFLEPDNRPLAFHEMVARAGRHGLQYLGESRKRHSVRELPEPLRAWARDRVELEQTLDFIQNTGFRRSLFCRAGVALKGPEVSRLAALRVTGLCRPLAADPDVKSRKAEHFEAAHGQLAISVPLLKALLVELHRAAPRALTLGELTAAVGERLGDAGWSELVGDALLECYAANLVELHLWSPRLTLVPGERPTASELARWQAAQSKVVTNRRHRAVELDALEQALLRKLDGTRDRAALLEALTAEGHAFAALEALEAPLARLASLELLTTP